MIPAFANGSAFAWVSRRALTVLFSTSCCQTRWNWSVALQIALPAPLRVHVPWLSDWSPTSIGFPTSLQFQFSGQGVVGPGAAGTFPDAPTVTPANVAVPSVAFTPELIASPSRTLSGMTRVTVLPGTSV